MYGVTEKSMNVLPVKRNLKRTSIKFYKAVSSMENKSGERLQLCLPKQEVGSSKEAGSGKVSKKQEIFNLYRT